MLETSELNSTTGYVPTRASASRQVKLTVDGHTVPQAFLKRVELGEDQRVYLVKRGGRYEPISWGEVYRRVVGIFSSLKKLGIGRGDKVCIMSQSRWEWNVADIANLVYGAVTVPIYHSNSVEDIAFILENCEAKLVYVEDEALVRHLAEALKLAKKKLPLVAFSKVPGIDGLQITPFSEFAVPTTDSYVEEELKKAVKATTPDAVASIVYTSGTTGQPKGAVLQHAALAAELRAVIQEIEFRSDDVTLTFLPFAHVFGRVESLMPVYAGFTLGFAESINAVPSNIQEVRPTILVSVPRIYEKIYSKILSEVESNAGLKKNIFYWAVSVGRAVAKHHSEETPVPLSLAMKYRIADQLVFQKIRQKLGGKLRLTVSGGAPLSPELCQTFHACGIKILEGYGLTETTAAMCCNRPDHFEFATVGKPIPGIDIRIAEDGEIQVRGPIVLKEYYRNPEATKEAFTTDGFFCTGDIGEITPRGNLKITDRKKELIVTSGGKKIAPQKLENILKGSRFISNAMVYGDKQKYIVTLLTLNELEVKHWAEAEGLPSAKYEDLIKTDKVNEIIQIEVDRVNAQLAHFETIKKFRILPNDWTTETGELTPSLKIKRKVIVAKFKSSIDGMY